MLQGVMFRAFAHSDSLKCYVVACCSVLQCVAVTHAVCVYAAGWYVSRLCSL